jgi:4,5-DOPA dioxygenase extradiol
MSAAAVTSIHGRTPVYFLGIGGPNFMENTTHSAYSRLAEIGREITFKVKPRAVVVISAHWQGSPSSVQVNVAEQADLIYDFYGFPKHFYDYRYPNKGSPEIAGKVIEHLSVAGIEVEKVRRGLDHGVWVGFLAGMSLSSTNMVSQTYTSYMNTAFDPENNPLSVPIVQISLYGSEDANQHYNLGKALQGLRNDNILIIGAGMSVHNLHDFRAMKVHGDTMP